MQPSFRLRHVLIALVTAGPLLLLSMLTAALAQNTWTTSLATKLGVSLERTFDSSGADAWDPK